MKKGLTELVVILDASGSMHDLTSDTIGGFNSLIDEQRKKEGEVLVSVVTFNETSKVIYDRVPLAEVKKMTTKDYMANGCTALIDAIGDATHHISNVHKYIREEDRPENTLFVITTDGMENSSHKYSSDEVKKMVKAKEELGWEFLFIGANIDAIETAKGLGIDERNAVDYCADVAGTGVVFESVSHALFKKRDGLILKEMAWSDDIKDDYESRKK